MSTMIYGYVRVSGKSQVEKDGPERQREAIHAFCRSHKLQQMGESFEKGVSGTVESLDRPAFADMLERIEDAARHGIFVTAIVVERMDRLARDLIVSELLMTECRKRGLQIYAVDRGALVDLASNEGDPTHKLIRQIIAAVSEFEKSTLVRKLRMARDRKKAQTGRCDGNKPYGMLPGEQEALDYLLKLRKNLTWTNQELANLMNKSGFRSRKGGAWTRGQVFDVAKNANEKIARQTPAVGHTV